MAVVCVVELFMNNVTALVYKGN